MKITAAALPDAGGPGVGVVFARSPSSQFSESPCAGGPFAGGGRGCPSASIILSTHLLQPSLSKRPKPFGGSDSTHFVHSSSEYSCHLLLWQVSVQPMVVARITPRAQVRANNCCDAYEHDAVFWLPIAMKMVMIHTDEHDDGFCCYLWCAITKRTQ